MVLTCCYRMVRIINEKLNRMIETITYPKETKAKKKHSCNFCLDKIKVEEIYIKSTHVFDGQIYDWKTHKNCSYIAKKLNMYNDCDDGVTDDIFQETISEKHFDLLISKFPENEIKNYSDIIQQLRYVRFKEKLGYVIRHYLKLDKESQM
jgi:hypothetical protein